MVFIPYNKQSFPHSIPSFIWADMFHSTFLNTTTRGCARAAAQHKPYLNLRSMSSSLPKVIPPLSASLPADAYQLLPTEEKVGQAEDALFKLQIQDVEDWWETPRYEGIKRPYSAQDVVSKRGSLQQTYPSSLMARKLFNLLKERSAAGQPVHTSV